MDAIAITTVDAQINAMERLLAVLSARYSLMTPLAKCDKSNVIKIITPMVP